MNISNLLLLRGSCQEWLCVYWKEADLDGGKSAKLIGKVDSQIRRHTYRQTVHAMTTSGTVGGITFGDTA